MSAERIPIQNIYFLLCYAWDHLQERRYADVRTEDCKGIWDLLGKVLARGAQQLVKRGLHQNYVLVRERRSRLKGKVLFSEDARHRVFGSPERTCEFHELSANVLPNQIIRTTLELLNHNAELDPTVRRDVREAAASLASFTPVRLDSRVFRQLQLHRNMRHYRFVLNVCEFVHTQSLASSPRGDRRFRDFRRDEASMGKLFEDFVRNFYRREQSAFQVSAPHVSWDVDESLSTGGGLGLLPVMKTDVCLQSEHQKIILDCKFYSDAFQWNFDRAKFVSSNLYQLFTYLKNQEVVPGWETATGMLLYPTVDQQFDERLHLGGHEIRLVTINLNQDWTQISADLLSLLRHEHKVAA